MSYSQSTKDQFLALRADGLSYAQCAQQLNVSKHTLVNWAKEAKPQFDALRAIHTEALLDQYHLRLEQRIILLAGQYHRVAQTIEKTDLLARGVGTLFTILLKLNTALDKYDQDPANYLLQEPQKTEPPVTQPEPAINPDPQSLVNSELTATNSELQKTEPKMNHPEVSSPSSTEHQALTTKHSFPHSCNLSNSVQDSSLSDLELMEFDAQAREKEMPGITVPGHPYYEIHEECRQIINEYKARQAS